MDIASNACDQQDIPVKQGTSLAAIALKLPWITLAFDALIIALYFRFTPDTDAFGAIDLDSNRFDEAYRWWTYCLLHMSPMHIGVNAMGWTIYGTTATPGCCCCRR